MEAVTVAASRENYIFPIDQKKLPDTGNYRRNNRGAFFFPKEDELIVITQLSDSSYDMHLWQYAYEFLRLDLDGNVLQQTIMETPLAADISDIRETGDGCYIAFLANEGLWDRLLCIDQNGQIKWINDDYYQTGKCFSSEGILKWGNDISALIGNKRVVISSEDGAIQALYEGDGKYLFEQAFNFTEGKMLRCTNTLFEMSPCTYLEIICMDTLEVEKTVRLMQKERCYIRAAQVNEDGSIILLAENENTSVPSLILLDSELNFVKSVTLGERSAGISGYHFFENDGLCCVANVERGDHSNKQYHIYRYDKHLNLIWESNVEASYLYYFKTSDGEIAAYRSMYQPERECFVDLYGVEPRHTHELHAFERVEPTCTEQGCAAYWYCTACACMFSDEGETLISSTAQLVLPMVAHTMETLSAVEPTCTTSGLSEGEKCSACGEVFREQQTVAPLGHTEEILAAKAPTCTETGLTAGVACKVCHESLTPQKIVASLGHKERTLGAKAPTCTETGLSEGVVCAVCHETLVAQKTVGALGHKEKTLAAKAPTCTQEGLTEGTECSVCHKTLIEQKVVPAPGHTEKVLAARKATCTQSGLTEGLMCSACDATLVAQETVAAVGHTAQVIPEVAPTYRTAGATVGEKCAVCDQITVAPVEIPVKSLTWLWVTIAVAIVLVLGGGAAFMIKKRR
jgi:hypothetical protein